MKKIRIIPILMMFIIFSSSLVLAAESLEQELRVLVIEQNPTLESLGISAAEKLGQLEDLDAVVDEMIEDIEYTSHGNVDVEIVGYEKFDEFVTSKELMILSDGSRSYTLDEDTWFDLMKNGWRTYWLNNDVNEIGQYQYDYNHLIDTFDLIERRNNGEFDQVWLVGVDPINPYETIMVGNNAYWVNGKELQKDCDNFLIMTLYVSRRDANFECYGHFAENVMRKVFGRSYDSYEPNQIEINSTADLEKLNLWERFSLTEYSTNGTYASVGNIHFSPNSEYDYDWLNDDYVESDWIDWRDNYPNLTGETIATNYRAWCPTGNKNTVCREHHRWWFSLFPHVEGRTEDGYSNNWWDYLVSLDFVTAIVEADEIELEEDEKISNAYIKVRYNSGKTEKIKLTELEDSLKIDNEKIVTFKNGKLVGKKEGETFIEVAIDGIYAQIDVEVLEAEYEEDEGEEDDERDDEEEWVPEDDEYVFVDWGYASEWAIPELETANQKELIPDTLEGRNYTEAITREEFASAMVKLYESLNGLKVSDYSNNPFIDTDNEDIVKAYHLGITNGTSANTFSPNAKITRQEIATMIMRLVEASGVYISSAQVSVYDYFVDDIQIADWAKESVYFMNNKGIIKGRGNGVFAPLDNTSIEEAIALSVRTLYEFKY